MVKTSPAINNCSPEKQEHDIKHIAAVSCTSAVIINGTWKIYGERGNIHLFKLMTEVPK